MAKQVITVLTDDLDGGDADRTIEFGLDGVNYTIDLSENSASKLRKALDPYLEVAARVGRAGASGRIASRAVQPARANRDQNQAIREWATKTATRCPSGDAFHPRSSRPSTPSAEPSDWSVSSPRQAHPARTSAVPRGREAPGRALAIRSSSIRLLSIAEVERQDYGSRNSQAAIQRLTAREEHHCAQTGPSR
jgi:hypothetical protein